MYHNRIQRADPLEKGEPVMTTQDREDEPRSEQPREDSDRSERRQEGGEDRERQQRRSRSSSYDWDPCGGGRRSRRGRKERVLHTRISEELSEDIRRLAEDLRVPTSNLVRNVLEEVFSVVETVSDNMGDLFEDLLEEADGARERVQRRMEHNEERRQRRGDFHRDWQRRRRERHHRRHRRAASDADVEQELRRDEEAERGSAEAERAPKEFPDVLGWQPLVLNRAQACADCGVHLQKGERAFLGVKAGGMTELALCADCVRS
jgi:hypothetical protein